MIERSNRIENIVNAVNQKFGEGSVNYLGNEKIQPIPRFSSQCIALDNALGGGWPKGRIIELFGPPSGGKSTTTLHAIAEFQKAGHKVAFIDVEHTLDVSYAESLGVDIGALLFSQPDDGDEAMRIVDSLVRSGEIGLIVVDSIASLVTSAEMEGFTVVEPSAVLATHLSEIIRNHAEQNFMRIPPQYLVP